MKTLEEALEAFRSKSSRHTGRGPKIQTDWESAIRLWFECRNQHTVATRLGMPPNSVSRILRACGIHVGRGKRNPVHQLPMDDIQTLYESGETTISLARRYGVDPEVIRRRMARAGIARRNVRGSTGERNHQWKGGTSERQKNREPHRLARAIAMLCLQERLPPESVVHHMDEDELNNDPANLWLFPTASHHARYHQRQLESRCPVGSEEAIRLASEIGGQALPRRYDLIGSLLDTGRTYPYGTRVLIENVLRESGLLPGKLVRPRGRQRRA